MGQSLAAFGVTVSAPGRLCYGRRRTTVQRGNAAYDPIKLRIVSPVVGASE